MNRNFFTEEMSVLRIYTSEKDLLDGIPFYEWLSRKACSSGMAGAAVFHGLGGFSMGNPVLSAELNLFRQNPPVVVEIIDRLENIENFVQKIRNVIPRGLMTVQPVGIRYYGAVRKKICRKE